MVKVPLSQPVKAPNTIQPEENSPNAAARWGARGTADGLLLPNIDLGLNNLEITAEAAIVPLDYRGILHVIFQ